MPDHLPRVRPTGWSEPLTRPAMANDEDRRPGLALTSRWVERDGTPWVPVSGEVHYSRVPRSRWRETLRLVRSGGVDVVATYVVWVHHEPVRGEARFDDGLDVAAFVRTCAEEGLHVVLRIGPWCHGEVRNGGLPDWVQDAPVRHRTDDPAYLDLVRAWFGRLGAELGALCGPDGPVLGIQLDNELYDQPGHLATLKRLAREAGLSAPLWTATAWGGAQLPAGEVLPLYGGYGDGFWVDADAGWHDTFRAHYQVSHTWDDPGIGADVRGEEGAATVDRDTAFPPATCELGGGMATTYHRRPVPSALDVAAVAHGKVASGSAWQGYYMYAGGTNPGPDLQESHATGYPNDLPTYDYDFHAAVGAAGLLAPTHAALRTQHAFLAAFGPTLATMPSTLPDDRPSGVDDSRTLRWSVRAADGTGFVFVVWHQPHVPLPTLRGVQVRVDLPDGPLVLPSRPVDVPPGTLARWPFGLDVPTARGGSVRLRWATASALTTLPDGTLVLLASSGVPVEVVVAPGVRVSGDGWAVAPGVHAVDERTGGLVELRAPEDGDGPAARVLVVGAVDADRVWVLDGPDGRVLLRSADPLWLEDDEVVVRAAAAPVVHRWTPDGWRRLDVRAATGAPPEAVGAGAVASTQVRAAGEPAVSYGERDGRASAPTADRVADLAAEHRFADVGAPVDGTVRHLHVAWAGDVAQLLVDGRVVADRFWDGTPWDVDLDVLPGAEADRVTLRVLPLHRDAAVWLPAEAADRRRSVEGPLGALDAVALTRSTTWRAPLT